jgi:hypothetical protein
LEDDRGGSGGLNVYFTAREDFDEAIRKGFWRTVASWFTRTNNDLLPFDEIRSRLRTGGEHYMGVRQIPVEKIVGSVNRYNDFDRAFLPRRSHTRSRWESIDRAHLQDVILPPIEVYKLGEVYFVRDGNHRVSVALERGQAFIDAQVIEIDLDVPIDENTDINEMIRLSERAQFFKQTRLKELCKGAEIELSLPGAYELLLAHIETHKYFMGLDQKRDVPYEQAVVSWYDTVYQPLVAVIRTQDILADFPHRTEADLYLWIIEHLWYLREDYKGDVTLEEAATHFAKNYSGGPFSFWQNLIHEVAKLLNVD